MNRTLIYCVVSGLLVGAVLMHAFELARNSIGGPDREYANANASDSGSSALDPSIPIETSLSFGDAPSFSKRASLHSVASRLDNGNELIALVQRVLRTPPSLARRVELEALLSRLFQIDPRVGFEFVQDIALPNEVLSSILGAWVRADTPTALTLLAEATNSSVELALALELLETHGPDDESMIDQVAAKARTLDESTLVIAAFFRQANADAIGALQRVSELEGREAQRVALIEVGRNVTQAHDPTFAVMLGQTISDPLLRESFASSVYQQWALTDVASFLEHLGSENPDHPGLDALAEDALSLAAASDGQLVLATGQNIGGQLGIAAEAAALESIAAEDSISAINYVGSLPRGVRRETLTVATAKGYARSDADAALSWVASLDHPKLQAKDAIMGEIALLDFARAVELELDDPTVLPGGVIGADIPTWFAYPLTNLNDPVRIANEISTSSNGLRRDRMLSIVLSRWAESDPGAAVNWIRGRHSGHLPLEALDIVAEHIDASSTDDLLGIASLLESDRRSNWIQRTLLNVAEVDGSRARQVAERYRGEPFYEPLVASVIGTVTSRRGHEAAAEILGIDPPMLAVELVSRRWARADPAGAAVWAATLSNQEARQAAVVEALAVWLERDEDAASAWALGVPDICTFEVEVSHCG